MPTVLPVEPPRAAIADLALQPDASMALFAQPILGGGKHQRRNTVPVPCGKNNAVAFPPGKADDLLINGRHDAIG